MSKFYQEYYWKGGFPYGNKVSTDGYKIVADPYRKWVSIEQYHQGSFKKVVYDSRFIDFRKLNPSEQTAWERELESEGEEQAVYLIRNGDDRLVYRETSFFLSGRCMECHIHSPQDILLSVHKMSYIEFGGEFNGVTLYDSNAHTVMIKKYSIDDEGQFSDLLEEIWDFDNKNVEFNLKKVYNAP